MPNAPESGSAPAAARKIRVLMLEDRAIDAELIVRQLRRAGYDPDWLRVDTEKAFVEALDASLDVILADYNVPSFDGLRALGEVTRRALDVPFIIISGALGEELTARCIKQGVTDYLLKDRLERLGLAVSHALEERRLRMERKSVEEQLRLAQKMEAIGQLAGGIAHDFNNVLTVINGWSEMLLETPACPPEVSDGLRQIYNAGERAASLTRQLLLFSHRVPIRRVALDLNQTIEEIANMLRRLIGENIELVLDLSPALPCVEADRGMIEQVLMNLAVNSRDAMPRGGRLVLATCVANLRDNNLRPRPEIISGPHVCLSVTDTGTGIAPEVLPKIFEPFFTTKEPGKGTGLGLATLFSIVRQHQGWIEVDSVVGEGTTFSVLLPASGMPAVSVDEPGPALSHGGNETILVVEDDTSVREFAVAALRRKGYRVLQAHSGPEALKVWKWHRARIDLVLSDTVMPDDMTGPELAQTLLAEKPSLGVILASGYTQQPAAITAFSPDTVAFLQKPYAPKLLSDTVRRVLDHIRNGVRKFP